MHHCLYRLTQLKKFSQNYAIHIWVFQMQEEHFFTVHIGTKNTDDEIPKQKEKLIFQILFY